MCFLFLSNEEKSCTLLCPHHLSHSFGTTQNKQHHGAVQNYPSSRLQSLLPRSRRPIEALHSSAPRLTPELRKQYSIAYALETIKGQYVVGTPEGSVAPDGYTLDFAYVNLPGRTEIQNDLIFDYQTNVALYPEFQKYLRTHQPPLLAVWGKNDPSFIPPGAEAFKRDLPKAEVHFVESGHFALESHAREIAALMRQFLNKHAK